MIGYGNILRKDEEPVGNGLVMKVFGDEFFLRQVDEISVPLVEFNWFNQAISPKSEPENQSIMYFSNKIGGLFSSSLGPEIHFLYRK